MKYRVGITGQAGFIGTHLFNYLGLQPGIERVPFRDEFFDVPEHMEQWVSSCDAIVHLAALNRHNDPAIIYSINIDLVNRLVSALEKTQSTPHILFASSTQEDSENPYGASKREGRVILQNWAVRSGARFTGFIIPNVFGPFGNPYYNSVIATFSHQLTHGETPKIIVDNLVKLIYVGDLVKIITGAVNNRIDDPAWHVAHTKETTVSDILRLVQHFRAEYYENHRIPALSNPFERDIFNTFRSYIDTGIYFPVKLKMNTDDRGSFVETIRSASGGQTSFSVTKPGITRGNHFHIRKVERFAVIRGQARIRLRRIGTEEIFNFTLDGEQPAFVDMPVWFTHNITNTGSDDLFTIFWINEPYDPADPDTFSAVV